MVNGQRYKGPEGRLVQAFCFALDLTAEQSGSVARHFGARRKAHNWALGRIKTDLEAYSTDGARSAPPSLYGLPKAWNQAKQAECVDADTGQVWWPQVSKEAFADGVRGTVDGCWRWQKSRAGQIKGKPVGFPRFVANLRRLNRQRSRRTKGSRR
jgi:putative transposase